MSNGRVCCLLGVCCPPGSREEALAQEIEADLGLGSQKTETTTGIARSVAEWILENYDIVPKGVGTAIIEAYRPEFKKLFGGGH